MLTVTAGLVSKLLGEGERTINVELNGITALLTVGIINVKLEGYIMPFAGFHRTVSTAGEVDRLEVGGYGSLELLSCNTVSRLSIVVRCTCGEHRKEESGSVTGAGNRSRYVSEIEVEYVLLRVSNGVVGLKSDGRGRVGVHSINSEIAIIAVLLYPCARSGGGRSRLKKSNAVDSECGRKSILCDAIDYYRITYATSL